MIAEFSWAETFSEDRASIIINVDLKTPNNALSFRQRRNLFIIKNRFLLRRYDRRHGSSVRLLCVDMFNPLVINLYYKLKRCKRRGVNKIVKIRFWNKY